MKKINKSISILLLAFCFIFTNTLTALADPKTDNLMNTGDFLSLVVNTLGYTEISDKTFNDVPKGSKYEEAVSKAIAAGLLTHKENSQLKPEMYLNKSLALSILTTALRADEEYVKELLEINSLSDGRSNLTKELADSVIKSLIGIKISGNSVEETAIETAYITKKGTEVKNLTANTLIITPSAGDGSIKIENSNISNLVVLKEGARNLTLINSKIDSLIIANEGVSLTSEGTTVNKLILNSETASLISKGSGGIKEISLEYQPSIAITNGRADKSKLVKTNAYLKLDGEFTLIKLTDSINSLSILPQKDDSSIKISTLQLHSITNKLQVWYKATVPTVGLTSGSKWQGNVSVEILNSNGLAVRKDTVTSANALSSAVSGLAKDALSAKVDSEVFASHNIANKSVPYNTKTEDLEMPSSINFTSNQLKTVTGSISWDYGKYDPKAAGKYVIVGKVSGTNVAWTPEKIEITVVVEDMLTFTIPYIQLVVQKDTSLKSIVEELLPKTATATLSDGRTVTVKISNWKCESEYNPNPSISTNYIFTGEISRLPASAGRSGKAIATVVVQLDKYYPFN